MPVPRHRPDDPLPPYTYVPGLSPHPVRDPRGHSHGRVEEPVAAPEVSRPWESPAFLRGVDLFNHGFYWEAHEAWEAVWLAAGRTSPLALFVKGLVKLAAAGVKCREGNPVGVERHARRAAELFDQAEAEFGSGARILGLAPRQLADFARGVAQHPPQPTTGDDHPRRVFDVVLEIADPPADTFRAE